MESDYIKLREIKPVLVAYIKKSQEMLLKSDVPDEKVIHDVRVLMKKARAVLKLAGPNLGNDFFKLDISAFREVGKTMCTWRDFAVHRKYVKQLKKEYPKIFDQLSDNEIIADLLKKTDGLTESAEELSSDIEKINDLLNKAEHRIRFQAIGSIDPHLHIKELESSYFSVVHSYLKCRNYPTPERIHQFRKKVKTFLYQLYYFRPLNSQVIKSLEKRLSSMGDNLGYYNDLSQLINALSYVYPDKSNPPALDELVIMIREKQDKYLSKVWPLAYKIFCPGQSLVNILGFKLLVI